MGQDELRNRDAEVPKAFSDAKPAFSLQRPIILVTASVACGAYFGSALLSVCLTLVVVIDAFSDVTVGNILNPPFLDNRLPSEGLTQTVGKVCPYWPKETVLGPKHMNLKHEDVELPTVGGAVLRGWLVHPTKAGSKSLLICTHGAGRDRRAWLRHLPFLLARGHTCLVFDFRGHGCSDKGDGFSGTSLGLTEMEDTIHAVKWAKKCMSSFSISLVGTSTGGSAAILAVSEDEATQKAVKCIVAENAFASPEGVTGQTVDAVVFRVLICKDNVLAYTVLYPIMRAVQVVSMLKTTWELKRVYRRVARASDSIGNVKTPLLLLHGTDDKIVSCEDSKNLHDMAKGVREGELDMWLCKGAEHCQLWDKEPREFEKRVVGFLERFTLKKDLTL